MIREVYKGVMKAVARQLTDIMGSDIEKGKLQNYETYLMSGEAFAYDELCKAFRARGISPEFSDIEQLRGFVSFVANETGYAQAEVMSGQERLGDGKVTFVALRMSNRMWRFGLSPTFMSTVSSIPNPHSHMLVPGKKLGVVLPDLDRMMPVLERMTRNIMDDAAKKNVTQKGSGQK